MSDPTARACMECGNLQSDGDFCEKCGAQLPPTVSDAAISVDEPVQTTAPPAPIPPISVPTTPVAATSSVAAPAAAPSAAESEPQAPVPVTEPLAQRSAATGAVADQQVPPPPPSQPPPPPSEPPPLQMQPPTQQAGGYGASPPPPPPPGTRGTSFFEALFDLSFTEFVTPRIVRWLFVLSLVVIGLGVLTMIVTGFAFGVATGLFTLLIAAPLMALFYVLIARLGLEVVVILFRMEEHLAEMKKKD